MENIDRYENRTWPELLEDPSFRDWQKDPDGPLATHWAQRVQRFPHLTTEIEQARYFLQAAAPDPTLSEPNPDRQRRAFAALQQTAHERGLPRTRRTIGRLRWSVAAAAVVLLFGLGWWFFPATGPQLIVHQTPYGEQRRIDLPDGTTVQLNAGSELSFYDNWKTVGQRGVWLSGEAYFAVTKGPTQRQAKFVVYTEDLNVSVLGTRFNVNTRSYLGTEVVLDEGSIELAVDGGTTAQETILVTPGEHIVFDRNNNRLDRRRTPEQSPATSWKEGRLVFEDVTLQTAAYRLEQIFGRPVRFSDPDLAQRKIYLTTSATDLSEFQHLLEAMLDDEVRVVVEQREVRIEYR